MEETPSLPREGAGRLSRRRYSCARHRPWLRTHIWRSKVAKGARVQDTLSENRDCSCPVTKRELLRDPPAILRPLEKRALYAFTRLWLSGAFVPLGHQPENSCLSPKNLSPAATILIGAYEILGICRLFGALIAKP